MVPEDENWVLIKFKLVQSGRFKQAPWRNFWPDWIGIFLSIQNMYVFYQDNIHTNVVCTLGMTFLV